MARISKVEKERIRAKILEESGVLFNQLGYDQTTTKQIAKQVGIAEGTIFNYFTTKEEIMFEVMYQEAYTYEFKVDSNIVGNQIVDEVFKKIEKILKLAFKIPKSMGSSFIQVALKLAKKNPEKFRKMAELDFKMMAEIEDFVAALVQKGLMKDVDPKTFSEAVFGAILFDFTMYFYSSELTKEDTTKMIRQKLDVLFKGYIKEEKND